MFFVFSFLLFLLFAPLSAQDLIEQGAEEVSEGVDYQGSLDTLEFRSFRPVFEEMDFLDPQYDLRYFNELKRSIKSVKDELVSTRLSMKFEQQSIDRTNTLRGFSYYRSFAPMFTNYYRYIMPAVRNQFYLLRSEKVLDDVRAVFKEKQAIFPLVVSDEAELKTFVYDLKMLSAMVHIFRGSERDLKQAVSDLEFLIGINEDKISYVADDAQKQDVYMFLIGIFDLLYKYNRADLVIASDFLRKKLFYLWNTVSDRNSSNEALKNVKLQILYDRYAPVMDADSRDYQELYKPYREKGLNSFKDLETEIGATGEGEETTSDQAPAELDQTSPDEQPATPEQ